jgi:D-3-phosphoglycerate dehydrogenase / 2-oxoglutarate reductase
VIRPIVFIPESIATSGLALLKSTCDCLTPWEGSDAPVAESQLREMLYVADAVIVRLFKITAHDLERASCLKVIAKHGAGVDNIDCQAATAQRIPVVYTPDATTNAVAEHTLALMLALARQVCPAQAALREGHFSERGRFTGTELAGKTLGIVGLGRIGARVAHMVVFGLGMQVHAYDPCVSKDSYSGPAILEDSLEALLAKADFLSLHVPLTPDTRQLINAHTLALLKPGCRLVNTSRGAVIDEVALVASLQAGQLAGAALDVFAEEPVPADHPLCQAPNILLTPHISSSTQECLERMSSQAAQGVLDVLEGRRPAHLVNPGVLG